MTTIITTRRWALKGYAAVHAACALMCAGTLYLSTKFYMPIGLVGWIYGAWLLASVFMVLVMRARRRAVGISDITDALWLWLAYAVVYFIVWLVTGGLMLLTFGLRH
uniref:Uncharacterized protein n=1 Tax=Pseudomonas phage Cygsa01 TaxID=3138529 RepID=A0AAU6W3K2_9VIRU